MERRPWLDRVADELARRGVPAGYRSRLLAELGDHIHDLTDEGFPMLDERLGEPEVVAAAAAGRLRGGWVRRHPVLVFGLAPVPMAFGVMVAMLFGIYVFGWAADGLTEGLEPPTAALWAIVAAIDFTVRFGAALAVVAVLARLAARTRVGRLWPAVAAVQVAVYAGGWATSPIYGIEPESSGFDLIAFLPLCGWDKIVRGLNWGQLLQSTVPLLVGTALFTRTRRPAGPVAAV